MSYRRYAGRTNFWVSNTVNEADYYEYIPEEVILNCPLFEVEYEPEPKIWRVEYGEGYKEIAEVYARSKARRAK